MAFFYTQDNQLAEVIMRFSSLPKAQQVQLLEQLKTLTEEVDLSFIAQE